MKISILIRGSNNALFYLDGTGKPHPAYATIDNVKQVIPHESYTVIRRDDETTLTLPHFNLVAVTELEF